MIKTNQACQGDNCTLEILHRPALRPFLAGKPSFARWTAPIEPHKRFIECTAVPAKSAEQQRGSHVRESSSNIQQWALQLGIQCPKLTVADFAGETFMAARLPNVPSSSQNTCKHAILTAHSPFLVAILAIALNVQV